VSETQPEPEPTPAEPAQQPQQQEKRRFFDRPLVTDIAVLIGLAWAVISALRFVHGEVSRGNYIGEQFALSIDAAVAVVGGLIYVLISVSIRNVYRAWKKLPNRKVEWRENWIRPGVALSMLLGASLLTPVFYAYISSPSAITASPSYTISGPNEGCDRFLATMEDVIIDRLSNAEAAPAIRELQQAARANDPLLASDLGDLLEARNATESSNATEVIVRRCVTIGALTQSEVQKWANRTLGSLRE